MKKRTLAIVLAAGLLAVAAFGGAALAQTSGSDGGAASFAARLADKLGLAEADVQTAVDEVRAEMREERLDAKLDALVESGKITQEQADEYRAWIESAPDGLGKFDGKRGHRGKRDGFGRRGHGGKRGWGGWGKDGATADGVAG